MIWRQQLSSEDDPIAVLYLDRPGLERRLAAAEASAWVRLGWLRA